MSQIRDASMARNVKLMPLSTDDKTEVLRKLQGSIHFEKTLTGKNVRLRQSLPSWFVEEHGDKIREDVILRSRSASTTYSWTLRLTIDFRSPKSASVRFGTGWKAFAAFHELWEGDSLVFSLTATSEFEVYLFRGKAGNPKPFPYSQPPRKRPYDSELIARKKAKRFQEFRDAQLAADGDIDSLAKSNGFLIAQKKAAIGESQEHPASASGNSPTSCRLSSYSNDLHLLESENVRSGGRRDSHNGHEPAIDHDKLDVMSDFDGPAQHSDARMKKDNEYRASVLEKKTRTPHLPFFFKKLTVSNTHRRERGVRRAAYMEIPIDFWRKHSSRLEHSVVKLQGICEESKVRTVDCRLHFHQRQTRICLQGAGWRNFADENNLEVGQELLFTLTGDSFFVVREALQGPPLMRIL